MALSPIEARIRSRAKIAVRVHEIEQIIDEQLSELYFRGPITITVPGDIMSPEVWTGLLKAYGRHWRVSALKSTHTTELYLTPRLEC